MTHLSAQQFSAHLDSALQGASLQVLETHLEACEKCRDEFAALTLQDQMLAEALRGESDRELFDLIGLRVQSVVHPQRARALEKSIQELEKARGERRRQAEAVAKRVAEHRQQRPSVDEPEHPAHEGVAAPEHAAPPVTRAANAPPVLPVSHAEPAPPAPVARPEIPVVPSAPPAPPVVAPEIPVVASAAPARPAPAETQRAAADANPPAEARRNTLEEALARAESEAREFARESQRAQEEAERRVLEHAALRTRHEAAARRKSEEDGRARAAASARVEAEHLARAADAALADAETSARDAVAAKVRAETRAAAAEEARRQAHRKADEARRLEAQMSVPSEAGSRAAKKIQTSVPEPTTLGAERVAAYREAPDDEANEDPPVRRGQRSRRHTDSEGEPGESQRSQALVLAALVVVLLAACWFAVGRQFLNVPAAQSPARAAVESPAVGQVHAAPDPAPAVPPAPLAPSAAVPASAAEEPHKAHRSAPEEVSRRSEPLAGQAPPNSSGEATVVEETKSATVTEVDSEEEPSVDLGLLCGVVRDEEHHPIAGARVMMADVGVVVVTDRVGRFCLTAPRGVRTHVRDRARIRHTP